MQSADAVIIGGGAVGTSIACRLAKAGLEVTLLEKGALCSGTSGANFAWVGAHDQRPFSYYQLRRASISLYPCISQELGVDVGHQPQGSILLLRDDRQLKAARSEICALQEEGYDIDLLDPGRLYDLEPAVSPNFPGATWSPLAASLNPFRLVHAYARRACEAGARICCHTEVKEIRLRDGQVHSVATESGAIRTKWVVNAAGVHAPHIGGMVGLDIPVRPVRGQILVTEPLPPIVKNIVEDMRQTPNGNLLVGRLDEEAGYADICTHSGISTLASSALEILPALRGAHVIRAYSGLRPMPVDGLPIFGEVKEVGGFFNAVMHSGVTLSAIMGILAAQLITQGEAEIPIDDYSLSRFHQ